MRKNKMMRAASALLVAVLLTTSTISGTFAKYVTQDSAKDVARVAKWGVELQVSGNLFGENYVDTIEADDATAETLAVMSNNENDIVAPGTENGEGFKFSINGIPEVSGKITVDNLTIQNIYLKKNTYAVMVEVPANTVTAENYAEFFEVVDEKDRLYYKDSSDQYVLAPTTYSPAIDKYYTLEDHVVLTSDYYPVQFSLAGKYDGNMAALSVDTLDEVAKTIVGKFGTHSLDTTTPSVSVYKTLEAKKFNPNTNLADLDIDAEVITWKWAFERLSGTDPIPMYDGADTILGMLMAAINDPTYYDSDKFEVVKLTGTDNTYIAAVVVDDYCLDVKFELEITVAQINEEAGV